MYLTRGETVLKYEKRPKSWASDGTFNGQGRIHSGDRYRDEPHSRAFKPISLPWLPLHQQKGSKSDYTGFLI